MSGMLRRLGGAWLGAGGLIASVMLAAAAGGFVSNWLWHSPGGSSAASPYEAGFLKAASVGASATHGNESVIMCTGEVDVGIEAVYILDTVTGELKGGVLNTRTGQFKTAYSYANIAKDLGADTVKNPKYLMVTGEAQSTMAFGGNGRTGRCVVYVAETNSGWVACYAAPWTANRATANNVVSANLILLDKFPFRQAQIVRPQ